MRQYPILPALIAIIFLQTVPAFCASMSLEVSVTIPEHVISQGPLSSNLLSSNSIQLVQTQTVVRNNQTISLTSIVVP